MLRAILVQGVTGLPILMWGHREEIEKPFLNYQHTLIVDY